MKRNIIIAAILSLTFASAAFAQSTVSGSLSAGGSAATTSTSTVSGTVGSGNSLTGTVSPNNTVTGTVGSGNSLTGTVTGPSGGGGGGGGGVVVGGNGPPVGFLGGGGGIAVVCPNLPGSLYTVPAGYIVLDGDCYPAELIGGSGPGIPTGSEATSTAPGIPNTGAGGNAGSNLIVLAVSGLIGALGGFSLYRRQFAKR